MLKIFTEVKIFLTHFAIIEPKEQIVRSSCKLMRFEILRGLLDSVAQLDRASAS